MDKIGVNWRVGLEGAFSEVENASAREGVGIKTQIGAEIKGKINGQVRVGVERLVQHRNYFGKKIEQLGMRFVRGRTSENDLRKVHRNTTFIWIEMKA